MNNTLDLGVPRPKLDPENKKVRATFSLPPETVKTLEILSATTGGVSMSRLVERAVAWLSYDQVTDRHLRLVRDPEFDENGAPASEFDGEDLASLIELRAFVEERFPDGLLLLDKQIEAMRRKEGKR